MEKDKYPIKLENPPIIDAIIEIRFESSMAPEILPGMIASELKEMITVPVSSLPILQIPDQVRNTDPLIKYSPYFKAEIDNYLIQFGSRVVAVSSKIPYEGWKEFLEKSRVILDKIFTIDESLRFIRVAIRKVNFFPFDVIERSTLNISSPIELQSKQYNHTEIFYKDDLKIRVVVANDAFKNTPDTEPVKGSILDIDSFFDCNLVSSGNEDEIINLLGEAHKEGNYLFFDLLNNDLIEEMGPTYG